MSTYIYSFRLFPVSDWQENNFGRGEDELTLFVSDNLREGKNMTDNKNWLLQGQPS